MVLKELQYEEKTLLNVGFPFIEAFCCLFLGPNNGRLWDITFNLPSSYISPSPSPDEMIIQQRGRRKIPVTWSPDINCRDRDYDRRDCTPVKPSPKKSSIVLRSTPRKRLLLTDPRELLATPEKNKKVGVYSSQDYLPGKMYAVNPTFDWWY